MTDKKKGDKGTKASIKTVKAMAKSVWDESGVLIAGKTHEAAEDLTRSLAPALKAKGLSLFTKSHTAKVIGCERQVDYILTSGRPRPGGKNWDRIVALADVLHPEPPFDTEPEIWTAAVQQRLATMDDVPPAYQQLVSDAIHGRPQPPEPESPEPIVEGGEPGLVTLDPATAEELRNAPHFDNPCAEVEKPEPDGQASAAPTTEAPAPVEEPAAAPSLDGAT